MDDCEKFNETSLPEDTYSNLNMKDITVKITCMQNEIVKISK